MRLDFLFLSLFLLSVAYAINLSNYSLDGSRAFIVDNQTEISVYPDTSYGIGTHVHYANFTYNRTGNPTVNISLVFDVPIKRGQVDLWADVQAPNYSSPIWGRANTTKIISGVANFTSLQPPQANCIYGDQNNQYAYRVTWTDGSTNISCFDSASNLGGGSWRINYSRDAIVDYNPMTVKGWKNISPIFTATSIGSRRIYTVNNVQLPQGTLYQTRIEYETGANQSQGKFTILVHSGSPQAVANGTAKIHMGIDPYWADGGTVTTYIAGNGTNMTVHTFTGNGTFTVNNSLTAAILVVAAGGGGGSWFAGGGGAGGLLYNASVPLPVGNFTVLVGVGGVGSAAGGGTGALNGTDSFFGNVSLGIFMNATGGGHGAGDNARHPGNGGSGGGREHDTFAAGTGIPGQGNNGGQHYQGNTETAAGGGGGGAGSIGGGALYGQGGNGGAGLNYSISGTTICYAGGGGGAGGTNATGAQTNATCGGGRGGLNANNTNGGEGVDGTGGGGGGGAYSSGSAGGRGGWGIVIISYPTAPPAQNTLRVGNAYGWIWATPVAGNNTPTVLNASVWSWHTWTSGSGNLTMNGSALDWKLVPE